MPDETDAQKWFKDEPAMLSLSDAATLLRCSRRQLNRYISTKRLRAVKLGKAKGCKTLIPRDCLAEFIARHLL